MIGETPIVVFNNDPRNQPLHHVYSHGYASTWMGDDRLWTDTLFALSPGVHPVGLRNNLDRTKYRVAVLFCWKQEHTLTGLVCFPDDVVGLQEAAELFHRAPLKG